MLLRNGIQSQPPPIRGLARVRAGRRRDGTSLTVTHRVCGQPPRWSPGELRPARGRSRLGRGIVHVIGGLGSERVGVRRAPHAYFRRSVNI